MKRWMALLRKEWGVYRTPIVGGAIVVVAPYVLFLALRWLVPLPGEDRAAAFRDAAVTAACVGLFVTVLMAGVFGAVAFAAERRDRSAEFLALLPVSRWRGAASKLALSIVCLAAMVAVHAGVIAAVQQYELRPGGGGRSSAPLFQGMAGIYLACLALTFGFAWLMSSFLRSPALAATLAVGAAVLVVITVTTLLDGGASNAVLREFIRHHDRAVAYGSTLGVGVLALAAGTAVYVRRVEP